MVEGDGDGGEGSTVEGSLGRAESGVSIGDACGGRACCVERARRGSSPRR